MEPLHARYPFLEAARRAVEDAAVDLATVVAEEPVVVDRAVERVESALSTGDVGEPHARPRVELLSYPVARVLVSLVGEPVLTRKYARAEGATAREHFAADLADRTPLKSASDTGVSLDALLAEFDLDGAVHAAGEGYRVDVGAYLDLAASMWGDEWRLVNRDLADGRVPVSEAELYDLLGQAVRRRVEDGLPLEVPPAVADELEGRRERVAEVLADLDLTREIDTVVPELFPPCMKHLLDRVQKGEHLPHHSRFAITAFLASIGMSTDEIVDLYEVNPGFGEQMTRYQTDHIRGETSPTQYTPPACATMQSYGDCVNKDDRCERISHPMAYYDDSLEDADDDLTDWREAQNS